MTHFMMDFYDRGDGAPDPVLRKSIPIKGAMSPEGAISEAKALRHAVTPPPTFFEVRIPGKRRNADRVIFNSERDGN